MSIKARQKASEHYAKIVRMLADLDAATECRDKANIIQQIRASAQHAAVRSDWIPPGSSWDMNSGEFRIMLTTGFAYPAICVQVEGMIHNGRYYMVSLKYCDWNTPWTTYFRDDDGALSMMDVVLSRYAGIVFGETE